MINLGVHNGEFHIFSAEKHKLNCVCYSLIRTEPKTWIEVQFGSLDYAQLTSEVDGSKQISVSALDSLYVCGRPICSFHFNGDKGSCWSA